MIPAFTQELIFSHRNVLAIAYCWLCDFNLVWFEFWIVHGLPFKGNFLSMVFQRSVGYSFNMLGTELGIVSGLAIKFSFVPVIIVFWCGWSFDFDVERNVTFFVFGLIIEREFFLDILTFFRIEMRLDFIRFKVLFVGSFQRLWIIMSLNDFISARFLFLGSDIIRFEVMMIGGFAKEFGVGWRAMMFAWDERKKYRKYRFDRRTCCYIAGTGP